MRSKTQSPTSARRSQTSWVLPRSTTIPATSTMAYPSLSGLRGWSGTSSLWGRRRERKNNRSSFMCERASNASKRLRIDAERARDYADSLLNKLWSRSVFANYRQENYTNLISIQFADVRRIDRAIYSAASPFTSIINTSKLSISCMARPAMPCKSP